MWLLLLLAATALVAALYYVGSHYYTWNSEPFGSVWDTESKAMALQLIDEVQLACLDHNVLCMAVNSTLLAAVRHKDFIPWNDNLELLLLGTPQNVRAVFSTLKVCNFNHVRCLLAVSDGTFRYFDDNLPCNTDSLASWPAVTLYVGKVDEQLQLSYGDVLLPLAVMFPQKTVSLSNRCVDIPERYHEILTMLYGRDYMTVCVSSSFNHRSHKTYINRKRCYRNELLKYSYSFRNINERL